MAKRPHYTYAIAAYNYQTGMNEILPATFTNKLKAIAAGETMAAAGAKNVRIICDQTKRETKIN